uniref:Placental growth factor n=1 Tax=Crocodylus porosus TaxID=8502 RepID=A0A7M4EA45_CROPO
LVGPGRAGAVLHLLASPSAPAAAPPWYLLDGNSQPLVWGVGSLPVLPFQEVWGRSFCRPLEKLVDIVTEYPSEVEHLFSPSCVSLQRCTGCCGDERLQCVPVETANITMQVGAGIVSDASRDTGVGDCGPWLKPPFFPFCFYRRRRKGRVGINVRGRGGRSRGRGTGYVGLFLWNNQVTSWRH